MENDLSPAAITDGLETTFVGQHLLYYSSIPSTMDAAKQAAQAGAVEGTIVIAEEQTAGRGRMERSWLSPPGGAIALSIILRPKLSHLPQLIMVASLAAVHSIEKVSGLRPAIKWPNDILIQGKKVCGILIESQLRGKRVDFTIMGIGLNVALDVSAFPSISATATSLATELGRKVSRRRILQCLLAEVERLYLAVQAGEPIYQEWRDRLETLGKKVRVKWGEGIEEGQAESVDSQGGLLLRRGDGTLARIVAGDVTPMPSP